MNEPTSSISCTIQAQPVQASADYARLPYAAHISVTTTFSGYIEEGERIPTVVESLGYSLLNLPPPEFNNCIFLYDSSRSIV